MVNMRLLLLISGYVTEDYTAIPHLGGVTLTLLRLVNTVFL